MSVIKVRNGNEWEQISNPADTTPIDATLKQEGRAADAKAVGEALKNKVSLLDALFVLPRTGKIYTVKVPRFAYNQTSTCEKLDDNAGLVCKPSSAATVAQDDYEDIPLFKWYNCNYLRDSNGHAYPIAIEGFNDGYKTSGSVDVGVIQMTPYIKWDESNEEYVLVSISDTQYEGFSPWALAKQGDTVYPYVIHSKYISIKAEDGLPRSQPGKIERNLSYNSIITNYQKKGPGYWGAGAERNMWNILFLLIKYGTKNQTDTMYGRGNSFFQYEAAIEREEELTYFPVTSSQASNIAIGEWVSIGYGAISNSNVSTDKRYSTMHKYADSVEVLKKETLEDGNVAIYVDVDKGFPTASIALSSTLTSPIYISSMPAQSGSTDIIKAHHDGQYALNSKFPYRMQGVEYGIGFWIILSDTVACFNSDGATKTIYVAYPGATHYNDYANISSSYKEIGIINLSGDFAVGDITFDLDTCSYYPTAGGASSSTGYADRFYGGGTGIAENTLREVLSWGSLNDGWSSGPVFWYCWDGLGGAYWNRAAAD